LSAPRDEDRSVDHDLTIGKRADGDSM